MSNKGTPKAILEADCCLEIVRNEVFGSVEMFKAHVDTRLIECKLTFSSMTKGVAYYKGSYYDGSGNEVKVLCTSFETYTSDQYLNNIETIENLMHSEQVRVWANGDLLLSVD